MGMIEGLKEAQGELGNSYENRNEDAGSFQPIDTSKIIPQSEIEMYAQRIREEKSALQEIKAYIEEHRAKIDKRLERIGQLEEVVEKIKENMKILTRELAGSADDSGEILKQMKNKIER